LEKRSSLVLEAPEGPVYYPEPSDAQIAAGCNFSAVTPNCLRTLYGTLNYITKSGGKSKMGLTDYLEEYNNHSDTYIFLEKYRPEAAEAAYEFQYVQIANSTVDDGTQHADDGSGLEANLDV
jgi:tripeptidyl-peptidase-1